MKPSRTRATIVAVAVVAVVFTFGCDPKYSVGPGSGTGGGGGGDTPAQVPPEAKLVGNLVALYLDVMQASLAKSADFDGGFVGHSSARIFTEDCITYATDIAGWDVLLDGCVDPDGTTYRGGGLLLPITDLDGYYFWPHADPSQAIIATNESNAELNHVYSQGNLQLYYRRSSGTVVGIHATNWVIHRVAETSVSLTLDLEYEGAIGSHGGYPAAGGTIQVSGDYMSPPFEILVGGGSTGSFTYAGVPMSLNLDSGAVSLVTN